MNKHEITKEDIELSLMRLINYIRDMDDRTFKDVVDFRQSIHSAMIPCQWQILGNDEQLERRVVRLEVRIRV